MKRLLSILLVFILLLVFAAGCAKAPSVADIPTTDEPDEQGITLSKCLEYGDAQWRESEDCFIEDLNGRFNPNCDCVDMSHHYEYKIYDASELSAEILENRKGTVIVERCIGFVTDKTTGDGKVLNAYDKNYDYISYRSVTDQKYYDGTVFISYMIYNPENNYIDDITERYDFVLCREWED